VGNNNHGLFNPSEMLVEGFFRFWQKTMMFVAGVFLALEVIAHILRDLAAAFHAAMVETGHLLPIVIVALLLFSVTKVVSIGLAQWAWARIRSRRRTQP
jgi:TRAP-type mannitol/chloroaromatic compound transport system permease small subunit